MYKDKLISLKHDLKDLQKEQFRQFLIANGVAEQCVIDDYTYSRLSSIVGCFKYNGQYFVYSTDEKTEYHNIQRHVRQIDAFKNIASRFGLKYGESKSLKK